MSVPILGILFTRGGEDSGHFIQKAKGHATKGGWLWTQRGLVPRMQGNGFAIGLGGIMEVAMWLCAPLLVGL